LLALAIATLLSTHDVQAQEVCYQDDAGRIAKRRRPGMREVPCPTDSAAPTRSRSSDRDVPGEVTSDDPVVAPSRSPFERRETNTPSPISRPELGDYQQSTPVPDRWRIVDALGTKEHWWDPYNRNVFKGDRPVHGDWFFNFGLISDTVYEVRDIPTSHGASSTFQAGALDAFGRSSQSFLVETLAAEFVYYKGDTVFKPPDWEFRFTPVLSYNRLELEELQGINVDPRDGGIRTDNHVGVQAAFIDKHLRNVSDRYDFDSIRGGIQPFSSDFRGFLFQDSPLGIRLFGTRHNNAIQYNLAWFRRLEKDTNSGLNDVGESLRKDDVVIANLYWQDLFREGFTSQVSLAYNRNRDDDSYFDVNGGQQRPAPLGMQRSQHYDVVYVGYNGDGHLGRINLTASLYGAIGKEQSATFTGRKSDVRAGFAALEASIDFDWVRPRLSVLYATGDGDPFDDRSTGYDAIFENPQFAGADTSYWIRQAVPLVGGGRVALAARNGVLNSLRSSKEHGQSNFTNPGAALAGVGVDMDLLPTVRLSFNANTIYFARTETIELARNQARIDRHIGYDVSASATYRPLLSQNIVVRGSYARLLAGDGFDALFPSIDPNYFLLNVILTY
jgi:hypothetical protein